MPKANQPNPRPVFPSTPINAKPPVQQKQSMTPKQRDMLGLKIGCGFVTALIALVIVIVISANAGNHSTSSDSSNGSTPTVDANLPVDQQINQIVQNAGATGHDISSTFSSGTVTVAETSDGNLTNGLMIDTIKLDCFTFQKALWTSGIASQIADVTVTINSQLVDSYGNTSTGAIGKCDLTSATAAKFNWDNLTFESAWRVYDSTYTLPSLGN